MKPEDALDQARGLLEPLPKGLRLELDDWGNLSVFVRRDMYHLDADALNDRLHAWVAREVHEDLPMAEGLVEFRHASPENTDEPELDVQAAWRHLEPTFRLDVRRGATAAHVERFAALVPAFLAAVHGEGRPEGWRDVEMGNAE